MLTWANRRGMERQEVMSGHFHILPPRGEPGKMRTNSQPPGSLSPPIPFRVHSLS